MNSFSLPGSDAILIHMGLDSRFAQEGYGEQLLELVSHFASADILEFGGGRSPAFALSDVPANVRSYTLNDIDQSELDLAPVGYLTACFDVCEDVTPHAGSYDMIFSKMLAEHVPDGRAMHANVLDLLRPGGVAFHYMPKLYALPFVVNWILPEALSRRILYAFFPKRISQYPKFPAYYSWCRGRLSEMGKNILSLGYDRVEIIPFYGHHYYRNIPVIRWIERRFREACKARDWSFFAAYVYVIAYKSSGSERGR